MNIPMIFPSIGASGFFVNLDADKWKDIGRATLDTLLMVGGALPPALALGLPLGIALYLCNTSQLRRHPQVYTLLALAVNLLRSVPFIILMITMIPVTLLIMGTSLGIRGAILPLVIGASPFYARLVESALREVDRGVVEAAQAMGATTWQLVWRVLLPEARPGLIAGATITAIAVVGFTAMGGAIGSGGLGDVAYREGYLRSHTDVALVTVIALLMLVQLIQMFGDWLVAHYSRR
ncbi:MAG TPA: methionine ABC transporter permease [Xylella fastidiosa subsp. multiplex]